MLDHAIKKSGFNIVESAILKEKYIKLIKLVSDLKFIL